MNAKELGAQPASPTDKGNCNTGLQGGLTKREAFALGAMPAVLAIYVEANGRCLGSEHIAYNTAAHSVRIADAMLAELAKE